MIKRTLIVFIFTLSSLLAYTQNNPDDEGILFLDTLFQLGEITQSTLIKKEFRFINQHKDTLRINRFYTDEKDYTIQWTKDPIPPKKEGVVTIMYDMKNWKYGPGNLRFDVLLKYSDNFEYGRRYLTIKAILNNQNLK